GNAPYDAAHTSSTLLLTSTNAFLHKVTTAMTFSNNGTNDTITRGGGNWATDGYQPGQQIFVTGAGNDDGFYTIKAGGVSPLRRVLTSNGAFAHANTADVTFGNNGTHDTIKRSDGANWTTLGFVAGQQIAITGAGTNAGNYTIDASFAGGSTLVLTSNGA